MPTTPSGTRCWRSCRPLGSVRPRSTSPIGSGSPATCRSPAAMPSMRCGLSASRSSIASGVPAAARPPGPRRWRPGSGQPREHVVGRGVQRGVLGSRGQRGQFAGGHPGPARRIVHLLAQVGHRRCLHTHYPSVSDLSAGLDGCQPAPGELALTAMAARICVVGSVNADLTFNVDALPRPGQTVLASSLASAPGGKGGNQAVAAARAGAVGSARRRTRNRLRR